MQYFRNQDDPISDPYLIGLHYQVGRSAFFEVQLTLAELADANSSMQGGEPGNPDVIQAQMEIILYDPTSPGCPRIDQYVWIDGPKAVKAKTLVDLDCLVYNPVTRNFNKLLSAEILENQPLFKIVTSKGYECIVSRSHKVIVNTGDAWGISLADYGAGREVLSFDEGVMNKRKNWNIYTDTLVEISDAGFGDVVKIELEAEFIYACGSSKKAGICAHNVKPVV